MNDAFCKVLFAVFMFTSFGVSATPNNYLHENQTLFAVIGNQYVVLSMEKEGTTSHLSIIDRLSLKWYSLKSNKLQRTDLLRETLTTRDDRTFVATVKPTERKTTTILEALAGHKSGYAGYPVKTIKPFYIDEGGIFLRVKNSKKYVVTTGQLKGRIAGLEDNVSVVGMLKEYTDNGIRYFLILRKPGWWSDIRGFEMVVSLPENHENN